MGLLISALLGLLVGAVAKFLMPGRDPGGCLVTMLLGILGAVVGAWIGRLFGLYQIGEPAGFIMSVIGAMIVLFLYRKLRGSPA